MSFGVKHITKETPMWATWMFRVAFLVVTTAILIIASDTSIDPELRCRVCLYLKGGETFIFGLSKMFGVDVNVTTDNAGNEISTTERPPDQP